MASEDASGIEVDAGFFSASEGSDYEGTGCDCSFTSSVNDYYFENGRRYHAFFGVDKNFMPTDEKEQDRLDLHHEILVELFGGELHKAPIPDDVERILDIGTGTGIWAIDMARKYPGAEIVGTDLSPIQITWAPENCRFEVDDAERDWIGSLFRSDSYDFIHARNLAQAVTDWEKVLGEAYRCCKPGGYVELSEVGTTLKSDDGTLGPDHKLKLCMDALESALMKIGRPPASPGLLKQRLENAGFVDIKQYMHKQPIGPWPKDQRLRRVGAMALMAAETGVNAYAMGALTRINSMSAEEATRMCEEGLADCKNKNYHIYTHHYIAYGRKPDHVGCAAQSIADVHFR